MEKENGTVGRVLSVQVGLPRAYGAEDAPDPMDRAWTTGFFKEPAAGPVRVGTANLEGDGQADRKNHGGPEKAVLGYAAAHYPAWREELGIAEMPFGAFGENLTLAGMTEETVCIGDVHAVGTALLQVSQPRGPCWKIARRWRIKDLSARVQRTGRTGWYYRVLREGTVEAGAPCERVERPSPRWTVALANDLLFRREGRDDLAAELLECPELAPAWRDWLARKLEAKRPGSDWRRLVGPNR
ncbi:MAG TPA: MOSC domain-containing protein [Longimicrobiaceae bacterium]|nr:MOSC domain-containing protein [Longimicrobiaceae bacterium]